MCIASRNLGVQNILHLTDGIAQTTQYDRELLFDYYNNSWEYNLSEEALEGLRVLEEYAERYDLVQRGRFDRVTTV